MVQATVTGLKLGLSEIVPIVPYIGTLVYVRTTCKKGEAPGKRRLTVIDATQLNHPGGRQARSLWYA
jgi:hypothetical protein